MTNTSLSGIAAEVATVDEAVMKALPFIGGIIGFVPGGAVISPFIPLITELLTTVDNAAKAVSAGNTASAATDVLNEVISHLTPGKPNSAALSPTT
jgi:hypothetical protein